MTDLHIFLRNSGKQITICSLRRFICLSHHVTSLFRRHRQHQRIFNNRQPDEREGALALHFVFAANLHGYLQDWSDPELHALLKSNTYFALWEGISSYAIRIYSMRCWEEYVFNIVHVLILPKLFNHPRLLRLDSVSKFQIKNIFFFFQEGKCWII